MSMLISQSVKEYRFPNIAVSAANLSRVDTVHSINGRIMKVVIVTNGTGSIFVRESGTNESFLNGPGGLSGAAGTPFITYPRVIVTNNVNTDLSGVSNNIWDTRITNLPMFYIGSGWTSGTSNFISGISVYYI